jgi:hypothetical protein
VQNDTLLALMLDPFLTFDEVMKEVGAIDSPAVGASPARPRVTVQPRHPRAVRRPAGIKGSGGPVIHHPPATAG